MEQKFELNLFLMGLDNDYINEPTNPLSKAKVSMPLVY